MHLSNLIHSSLSFLSLAIDHPMCRLDTRMPAKQKKTDGFVLDNRRDLLNCLRRCNIALRWRILHRRTADVALREIICAKQADGALTTDPKLEGDFAVSESHVISLLLLTSQLEMQLKDTFRQLLERREDIWSSCKTRTSGMMSDLAGYFGGGDGDGGSGSRAAALSKVDRHEGLSDWFAAMADEVNALSYESGEHVTVRGRRIQHCVQSLEEIELFDVVDRDVQARAFVGEARGMLLQMARAVGISSGVLDDMAWISDMSYGVECIRSYVDIIHARISKVGFRCLWRLSYFRHIPSCAYAFFLFQRATLHRIRPTCRCSRASS